jgi:ABC-type branched-subunit amino acid transport system ATPase component/ABC-type branched-subunit amino acid transport system permease subunit
MMATLARIRGNSAIDMVLRIVEMLTPFVSPVIALYGIYYLYHYGTDTLSQPANRADLSLFTFGLMWIGLTSSWNLIAGYTGYIDFGHTVFVGIGSYVIANMMWSAAYDELALNFRLSFYQALPIAFVVGALFAGLVGWPTLRLKGPYFAIAMLGTFVAVRAMTDTLPDLTRGGQGIQFRRPFADPFDVYHTMLILAGITFLTSLWIYRSQLGKKLQSIREDEVGADMRGINTTAIKIGIFMLAGGFTATIGATRIWGQTYVEPTSAYPDDYTITMIMMAMLGGIGRPWGPVVGATVFYYARTTFWAELGSLNLLMTGVFLIVLVLFIPNGILGFFDPEDRGLGWHVRRLRRLLAGEKDIDPTDEDFDDASAVVTPTSAVRQPHFLRRLLPARIVTYIDEHSYDDVASVITYPAFMVIIVVVWIQFFDQIHGMIPEVVSVLSAGDLVLAFLLVYLRYLTARSVVDLLQYRAEDAENEPRLEKGTVLLEGRKIVKDFGGLRAVNAVDFEVRAGEIVGLLGPNGSGKTTLFNCISGVLPITDGEIMLRDTPISKKASWRINRLGLARTFQKIRVFDNLTVYDNMLLSRKWEGVPRFLWFWIAPPYIRRQVEELLDFLLLTVVQHNLASNLSGGQQRLLEIGMSLMSNPDIVLLDEATSGVNPALIEEIKRTILRLNRERGVTFFLIEHNMNFVMDMCERLYVLDYGVKIAEGGPQEIQENADVIEAYFGREE